MTTPSSAAYLNSFTNAKFFGNPCSADLPHQNQLKQCCFVEDMPSNPISDMVEMEINEEHGSKYEANYSDVLTGNSINNSRKRRLIYENDVPLCKRRMEKVSARLENFHISNDPGSSLLDIKDSDSEDTGEEDIEKDDTLLILDERLRKYIEHERKAPPIAITNPLSMALVPYVPPILYENPTMTGRIKEINNEDAVGYASNDNGFVTFPDDGYSTDLGNRSTEMISQSTKLLSSIMNETEIDTSVQDDVLMDMDSL